MSQMKLTTLFLYNSDGQHVQAFQPRDAERVRLYCCGPTVYNYAHIGNLRAYTVQDILRRTLLAVGYKLNHVMNITDVGHLSDDGDNGEDKMLISARQKGKTVQDIANYYTQAFLEDCAALHIAKPEIICRASDHIHDMQKLIAQIEAAGYTYYSNGNLYFDTSKLADYGRLAGLDQVPQDASISRIGLDDAKRNQRDFVLWFSNGKFSGQAMQWNSPWGCGYPGWHIECSAMANSFLGNQIDIHCGGVDHKTVHHSNEIAQSESLLANAKKPWVKFWLHNEFVVMNNQADDDDKISKSSGNAITLQNLQEQNFSPLDYRYFLLGTHYRNQVQFHYPALKGAQTGRRRLQQKALELLSCCARQSQVEQIPDRIAKLQAGTIYAPYMSEFFAALLQDLHTSQALASLWSALKDNQLSAEDKLQSLEFGEAFLQIGLFEKPTSEAESIPAEYLELLSQRNTARKEKNYQCADELRAQLQTAGYQIIDTAQGPHLKRQDL